MNRLSFLKSLLVAPSVLPTLASSQVENIPAWPFKEKLYYFQEEIWKDYNLHKKNLFIMMRGSGKTFMAKRISSLVVEPDVMEAIENLKNGFSFESEKEFLMDELTTLGEALLKRESFKTTIFTSIHENENLLMKIRDGHLGTDWNVKTFGLNEISREIDFDASLFRKLSTEMPEQQFSKEFFCLLD